MPPVAYQRAQAGWPVIVIVGAVFALITVLLVREGVPVLLGFVALVCALVVVTFGWLTVTVDDTYVRVRFGAGLVRKRVALSDVRKASVVRTPWYYGTGIRIIPDGWLYNVSGRNAVQLDLPDGRRVLVGSAEPQRLLAAIETARPSAPTGESDAGAGPGFRWILAFVAPIFAALGLMMWVDSRPPSVQFGDVALIVRSGTYKATIPWAAVTDVIVTDSLPRIERRTNGYAVGRARRGHFRLSGLGDAILFLELRHPPFVIVKSDSATVIVGYDDPARTADLVARLSRRASR